jgi:16S rRNA (adenine1518-N6/adenine1519-N6)-dimethyltransferase
VTRLGQHFLADRNLLRKIVAALDPQPGDVVLEIGPGTGTLTAILAPLVSRVIAIEKDRRLADECGRRNAECGIDNVSVVVGDALKLDWHALLDTAPSTPRSAFRVPHFKVIGNIPYYITSPLIEKALTPPLPTCVVFLVQREVADRLAAQPGGKRYGALSVGVQAVCRVEQLFVVKAGAFRPAPRVDSAVVRFTPRPDPLIAPDEAAALRTFVAACFSRRRKQLRNAVMAATGWPAAAVSALLAGLGLEPASRPETLGAEAFARLLRASR